MDAFGAALARAAETFAAANQRLPLTAEVADALREAIREARDVSRSEAADRLLARWCNLPRIVPSTPRPRAKAGDIVQIPYGGDGAKHVFARVLFAPSKQHPGPGLGLCMVVHDLDAPAPLDAVRASPLLLRPFHIGEDEIAEGRWRIVGHVEPHDADLPVFASQIPNGAGGWRSALHDYFRAEVPDTPANRARVVEQSVGPASHVVVAIRMLRGLVGWLPSYAELFQLARPS
jgi:hypothetical protein